MGVGGGVGFSEIKTNSNLVKFGLELSLAITNIHRMRALTKDNPKHMKIAQNGGDHYEGEGQGPEHVQVAPARVEIPDLRLKYIC